MGKIFPNQFLLFCPVQTFTRISVRQRPWKWNYFIVASLTRDRYLVPEFAVWTVKNRHQLKPAPNRHKNLSDHANLETACVADWTASQPSCLENLLFHSSCCCLLLLLLLLSAVSPRPNPACCPYPPKLEEFTPFLVRPPVSPQALPEPPEKSRYGRQLAELRIRVRDRVLFSHGSGTLFRVPGWKKIRIRWSGMNILDHCSESLETVLG